MSEEKDGAPKNEQTPNNVKASEGKRAGARRRPSPVIEGVSNPMSEGEPVLSPSLSQAQADAKPEMVPSEPSSPTPEPKTTSLVPGLIAGGLAGLFTAGLGLFFATWLLVPGPSQQTSDENSPRLFALEKKLNALEIRAAGATGDTKKIGDDLVAMRQAMAGFDTKLAALAPQNAGDIGQSEAITSLRQGLLALEQKIARFDHKLAEFVNRNDLAQEIDALRKDVIAKTNTGGASTSVASLLIAVDVLKGAVDRGDGYGSELEAARALGLDASIADRLQSKAQSGVPTVRQLSALLSERIGPMLTSLETKPEGVIDQLLQSAKKLIRIRPVGEVVGSDPAAILARLEAKLHNGDVQGALQEALLLPEPMRQAADRFLISLTQRANADQTLRALIAELVKNLPKRG